MTLDDQLALRAAWYRRDEARKRIRVRLICCAGALAIATLGTAMAFLLTGRG